MVVNLVRVSDSVKRSYSDSAALAFLASVGTSSTRCCLQQITLMTPATRKNRAGGLGGFRRVGF